MAPEWIKTQPIAHRGLHDERKPENSMAAFKAAEAAGYAIELDVQLMKDGNIAVFHDDFLDRMTSSEGDIRDLSVLELRQTSLKGNAEPIPTLDKVFEQIKAPIYIDVKSHGPAGKFEQRLLALIRHYKADVAVASFNPQTVLWFKEHAPDIPRGIISYDYKNSDLGLLERRKLRNLKYNRRLKPDFISYDLRALPFWRVWIARKLFKIPVVTWTVQTEADLMKAKKVADNYVFEGLRPVTENG